ncbi:bifunctional class I SAM-dependent methyltransferase/NUDIX hydrolase [Streptomyces sp. bgisy031]|uniref:bifunctional class I SAM-dependent methyltransferase/NUDIX hydrolase n=1 Tax=Streptomyces sp. bgisy031 TaxID=3413772 RepID=UPI003D75E239
MSVEARNEQAWTLYGQRQLDRGFMPPVPEAIKWGPWEGVGPGSKILGDLTGRRVLDIGSGAGHYAVHLARAHGARVTAIERSATQHARATLHHGGETGVDWVHGDVIEHLRAAEPYEAAYAVGTLAFLDPHVSLPALRDALATGAPLVFSVLHTDLHGHGPSTTVAPREQQIRLRQEPAIPVDMFVLVPHLWEDLLTSYGFQVEAMQLLTAPDADDPVVHQLIRARRLPDRRTRISSRPRSQRPPAPHAAVGVGAVVLGDQGLLLGRHRLGTIELPGGTVEAGEAPEEAVVRELAEETGLTARPEDVLLLGTLVDHLGDVVRVTIGAVVSHWEGEPATQPDESVGDWRWCPLDDLPSELFECSAQILTAWRPGLPIDHPPAHFTPYARRTTPSSGRKP